MENNNQTRKNVKKEKGRALAICAYGIAHNEEGKRKPEKI